MKIVEKISKCKVRKFNLFSCKLEWKNWDYVLLEKDTKVSWYDGVICFGIDKNNNIAIIKNYRFANDLLAYEVPRWSTEKWEDVEETALKEFEEEIWIKDKPLYIKKLWELYPETWLMNSKLAVYLLKFEDFSKYNVWWKFDWSYEEIFEKTYVSILDFKKMIRSWEIKDSFSISAYSFYDIYI